MPNSAPYLPYSQFETPTSAPQHIGTPQPHTPLGLAFPEWAYKADPSPIGPPRDPLGPHRDPTDPIGPHRPHIPPSLGLAFPEWAYKAEWSPGSIGDPSPHPIGTPAP